MLSDRVPVQMNFLQGWLFLGQGWLFLESYRRCRCLGRVAETVRGLSTELWAWFGREHLSVDNSSSSDRSPLKNGALRKQQ